VQLSSLSKPRVSAQHSSIAHQEILEKLSNAVIEGDDEKAKKLAKDALDIGMNPLEVIEKGLVTPVRTIGERFARHEVFIPDLIMAGNAMRAGCDILRAAIPKGAEENRMGRILIGTVEGDMHSIGKDLVITMLESSGFDVANLGEDVHTRIFLQRIKELRPDALGLSALMTVTMPKQKEIIRELEKSEEILVGGSPTTQAWADEIGADGWAQDAVGAVAKVKSLLRIGS